MNRLVLLALVGFVAVSALAQQPGSESTDAGRTSAPRVTPPVTNSLPATKPSLVAAPEGATAPTNVGNQAPQPATEIIPEGKDLPSADPVLERKELPKSKMSLIGGRVTKVDRIRDRVNIQPFGGGKKLDVRFDERSHIYRNGRETTMMGINKGDRIYADTMLVEGHIFAKNLRVVTKSRPAESRGQLTSYNAETGRVGMRDTLTGQEVVFFVSKQTAMNKRGAPASLEDLKPGALLEAMIVPGAHGGAAKQVTILAVPGEHFIFAGQVTNLDLSRGVLNVNNDNDQKNYEVHFSPAGLEDRDALRVGKEIEARVMFDGQTYRAKQVTVIKTNAEQ
jgi:hypothetical protein